MAENEVNTLLLLHEMPVEIRYGDLSETYPCQILFDINRDNTVSIKPVCSIEAIRSDPGMDEPFYLSIPGVAEPVECHNIAFRVAWGGEQEGVFAEFAPRFSQITHDSGKPLFQLHAGILNLGYYIIDKSRGLPFSLLNEDWEFRLTPVGDRTLQYPANVQCKRYIFTHHLSVKRVSGQSFSTDLAMKQLQLLSTFLSFCRGGWVSTALTYGICDDGSASMEVWGTGKVSKWREPNNWLDLFHGQEMASLFPGFAMYMNDSASSETIEYAIYWYIRADTNFIGPDGACLLLQAALERLAWHVLVRDRRSLSEDGFGKLPAADQIRLLLSTLGIPLAIPEDLSDLVVTARSQSWSDGPAAFVGIRNRLVHPPRKVSTKTPNFPYYDAYRLAKWYVELVILALCGYKGTYSNQTRKRRWRGSVERVPWV